MDEFLIEGDAVEISKKVVSKIKPNLFYAFAYNITLIPIAVVGLLVIM